MNPEQELDFLKNQAQMIRNQLSGIESRIEELEEK
jgi:prefoldin subunit 5